MLSSITSLLQNVKIMAYYFYNAFLKINARYQTLCQEKLCCPRPWDNHQIDASVEATGLNGCITFSFHIPSFSSYVRTIIQVSRENVCGRECTNWRASKRLHE